MTLTPCNSSILLVIWHAFVQGRTFEKNLGVSYVLGPTFVVFVFGKKSQLFKAHRR